jgi:hypothetical protein
MEAGIGVMGTKLGMMSFKARLYRTRINMKSNRISIDISISKGIINKY